MPGHCPSFVSESLWQIPQACTFTRTCPAVGLGISRSTISKSPPGLGTCTAFIGAIPTFVVAITASYEYLVVIIMTASGAVEYCLSPLRLHRQVALENIVSILYRRMTLGGFS